MSGYKISSTLLRKVENQSIKKIAAALDFWSGVWCREPTQSSSKEKSSPFLYYDPICPFGVFSKSSLLQAEISRWERATERKRRWGGRSFTWFLVVALLLAMRHWSSPKEGYYRVNCASSPRNLWVLNFLFYSIPPFPNPNSRLLSKLHSFIIKLKSFRAFFLFQIMFITTSKIYLVTTAKDKFFLTEPSEIDIYNRIILSNTQKKPTNGLVVHWFFLLFSSVCWPLCYWSTCKKITHFINCYFLHLFRLSIPAMIVILYNYTHSYRLLLTNDLL